ncbi:MAG: beta-lactamase family protein [Chitinophagaceae bacterium]|nr:beta-lactamase family protein [Chitinophagaceae bacterium]
MQKLFFVIGIWAGLFVTNSWAQVLTPVFTGQKTGLDAQRLTRIDKLFQQYVDSQWIAGATAIVAKGGKIVYHKAFGYTNAATKSPMKVESIFRIASQTKAITSVGVMILLEEGKLLLDDPVSRYLPEFAKPVVLDKFQAADSSYTTLPAKREITIRHLLTHTSGLGYAQIGSAEMNAIYAKADITAGIGVAPGRLLATDMKKLARMPLVHHPGEKYTYGLNTDVLGYLIEVVSGQTLDRFFKERIFDPLGMRDTWFYLPAEKQSRLVTLHTENDQKKVVPAGEAIQRNGAWLSDYPNTKGTYYSGGAGLSSTAYDYAVFMEMLRNGGIYNGRRIISKNSVDMMTQNQIGDIDRGPFEKFGLGFGIITEAGSSKLGLSTGSYSWGGAFSSTYWIDPAEQLVGQVFINQMPITRGDIHDKFKILLYSALE